MYEKELKFAISMAKYAGRVMNKYFSGDNGSSYKKDNSIVTLADTDINSYLISQTKKKFPTDAVDGEEEKFGKSNRVWVCDPVDGTAMFARHIPVAVFSIALVIDGKSVLGAIYDPFMNQLYTATLGGGAFVNGKPLQVNAHKWTDKESVVSFDMIPQSEWNFYKFLDANWKKSYYVSMGSCIHSCCCVATGDFVAHLFCGSKGKNSDIAAVKVIIEEAGGKVTDIYGKDQCYDQDIRGALVSNGVVHDELLAEIKRLEI